jgi:hypothetical protein
MISSEDVRNILHKKTRVVLEIGCGTRKINPDAIGVDIIKYPCVDLVGDVFEVLNYFPDASVDEVTSSHFLEHVSDVERLLYELARVLKRDADMFITVPHFTNPYYYSDPTHRTFFGLYTMSYFSIDKIFSRKVPTYQNQIKYVLIHVELCFKSSPPFYVRHVVKRLFGRLINFNNYTRELYEEMLCHLLPCYEIKYHLKRI